MPVVNPMVLRWARETAGLTPEVAADKVGIHAARGQTGAERLLALEAAGDTAVEISRPVLLKLSKAYRRPLLAFYLNSPPARGNRGEDFRTLPDRHTGAEALVDALVRNVRSRQAVVCGIRTDEENFAPLGFVGSMKPDDGIAAVLESIRTVLGVDLAAFRAQGDALAGFTYLRERTEAAGIYVLLIGNLGSHHSAIDVDAFRGLALADPVAPFVVINDQDAKTAWSFTLLHEVVHLWLGETGVSGGHLEGVVERFCNDAASAFLLPPHDLAVLGVSEQTPQDAAMARIAEFSTEHLVSRSMVAYRLFRAGKLSERRWQALNEAFRMEWIRGRALGRERMRDSAGGPNYYVVRRHRLGTALLDFVARSMNEGWLTATRAGKLLGVKPRSVHALLDGISFSSKQRA